MLVVSFAPVDRLRIWVDHLRREFLEPRCKNEGISLPPDPFDRTTFASDVARSAYHLYGLGRNSPLRVFGPKILWQYARWAAKGNLIVGYPDDPLQRGGDFVVGRDDRLALSHSGRDQADRPGASVVLNALREGALS
jgi:hypothetical protein